MLRVRGLLIAAAAALFVPAVYAQGNPQPPTDQEVGRIGALLQEIGCRVGAVPVEREHEALLEVDDAMCAIGVYDIKIDRNFNIVSMTLDGPVVKAGLAPVTAEELDEIARALGLFNCRIAAATVEREGDDLFDVDDAECDGGQYDLKLNGRFHVLNLTADSPEPAAAPAPAAQPNLPAPAPEPPVPQGPAPVVEQLTPLPPPPTPEPPAPASPPPPAAELVPPPATVDASVVVDLRVRAAPANDAPVLVIIPAGVVVPVYRCTLVYAWCETSYAERTGWVAAGYLRSDGGGLVADTGAALGLIIIDFVFGQPLPQPGPGEVCFYSDFNHAGAALCGPATESVPALGADWNDRISSIRLGSGAAVEVCTEVGYGGTCAVFRSTLTELVAGVDNAISSYRPAPPPAPLPTPAADEICFYSDFNFAGEAFCVPATGSTPILGAGWNDKISSIRVGANAAVQICTNAQYSGTCAVYVDDVAELAAVVNDAISSHRPPPLPGGSAPPLTPTANEVCFYADFNFAGASLCVPASQSTPALAPDWDDRISSIRMGTNAAVEVCTDAQYAGTCTVLRASVAELPANLNEMISSHRPPPATGPTPLATPGPTEVCFYSEIDFAGAALCVPEDGPVPDIGPDWNDRISSIRVGANAAIEVCSGAEYAGTCALFLADVAALPGNLDNAISSHRSPGATAAAPLPTPAAGEVCFYADFNFEGAALCVPASGAMPALAPEWNDRISSIRVGANAEVQVCTATQFGGTCALFGADVAELPANLDDAISSYRPPAAAQPATPAPPPVTPVAPATTGEGDAAGVPNPAPPAAASTPPPPPPPARPDPVPVAVEAPPVVAGQVCFFADADLGGDYFCTLPSTAALQMPQGWDNRVSSIRVDGVAFMEICTDTNFRATCQTITATVARLPAGLDDGISSFRFR